MNTWKTATKENKKAIDKITLPIEVVKNTFLPRIDSRSIKLNHKIKP